MEKLSLCFRNVLFLSVSHVYSIRASADSIIYCRRVGVLSVPHLRARKQKSESLAAFPLRICITYYIYTANWFAQHRKLETLIRGGNIEPSSSSMRALADGTLSSRRRRRE